MKVTACSEAENCARTVKQIIVAKMPRFGE